MGAFPRLLLNVDVEETLLFISEEEVQLVARASSLEAARRIDGNIVTEVFFLWVVAGDEGHHMIAGLFQCEETLRQLSSIHLVYFRLKNDPGDIAGSLRTLKDQCDARFLNLLQHAEVGITLEDAGVSLVFGVEGHSNMVYCGVCFAIGPALEEQEHRPARFNIGQQMTGGCFLAAVEVIRFDGGLIPGLLVEDVGGGHAGEECQQEQRVYLFDDYHQFGKYYYLLAALQVGAVYQRLRWRKDKGAMPDYNNIRMNVPESTRVLLSQLVIWAENVTYHHKQAAFERIKQKLLREDLRRLGKGAFMSNSTTDNFTSVADSLSIYDFRPLQQNYTSVKIMDYQTHGVKRDLKDSLAHRIDFTQAQIHPKDSFLEKWMVQQSTPPLLPENYPLSDYALKKMNSYHEEALATIRKLTFSHYCRQHLRSKPRSFSLLHSDPLKHKTTMISHSLTYLSGHFNQIALKAFQILLRAGGEQESERTYLFEISRFVDLAQSAEDAIKEELFLQVIKQTSSGKLVYTRILCCLCYCVKVPTRLYVPLLNYLYEETRLSQNTPKELFNYCFYHIIKNFDKKRRSPPCLFELYCAYHATKVPIIVKFPREKAFFVESYSTVEELMTEVIEFYNLDANIQYLLEVNGFLMERGVLLENLGHFCELQEEDYKWKDYQQFRGLFAVIVLKNADDSSRSAQSQIIMYNYCVNQYLNGFYPLTSNEIIRIAALKMHCELEDEYNYNFEYENLISRGRLRGLSSKKRLEYHKHILKQYYQVRHLERGEARELILAVLSKNKGFATHFFKCEVYEQDFETSIAWVGVQRGRFLIVEASSGRVMRTIAFNRIREWGRSSSELCLRVDSIGELHLQSPQAEVLTSVFQAYIDYHMQLLCLY